MINREAKAAFYSLLGPVMTMNGIVYKYFRAPKRGNIKVHLGPGQEKYLDGWINVDANIVSAKVDVWCDLRNPLPFRDQSIDAMYSHHMIEHLPSIKAHLVDVYRCLQPGGVYRVGGPNGDSAISKFMEKDEQWFGDFPDNRSSIGGRFENFIFCRQEHLTILTFSFLEELMSEIGFSKIRTCMPSSETNYPNKFKECVSQEVESDFTTPHTLIVEAMKP